MKLEGFSGRVTFNADTIATRAYKPSYVHVDSAKSGMGQISGAEVQATLGGWAQAYVDTTVIGFTAASTTKKDAAFMRELTQKQRRLYQKAKENYDGGLNIPLLSWIGIDLGGSYTSKELDDAMECHNLTNGARKELAKVLGCATVSKVRIKGTISVTGVNPVIPSRARAYVTFSVVEFSDGKRVNMVNSHESGVGAVDENGQKLSCRNTKISVSHLA